MIHSSMKTTIDVGRQTRKFYLQANLLLRNFRHCSDPSKMCSISDVLYQYILLSIVVQFYKDSAA